MAHTHAATLVTTIQSAISAEKYRFPLFIIKKNYG